METESFESELENQLGYFGSNTLRVVLRVENANSIGCAFIGCGKMVQSGAADAPSFQFNHP